MAISLRCRMRKDLPGALLPMRRAGPLVPPRLHGVQCVSPLMARLKHAA